MSIIKKRYIKLKRKHYIKIRSLSHADDRCYIMLLLFHEFYFQKPATGNFVTAYGNLYRYSF